MTDDLAGYVAECERKIEALETRLVRLESRVDATIKIATREATAAVVDALRDALDNKSVDL